MLEKKSDGLACSSAALKMITKLVNNFGYASAPIHLGCIARLGNLKTRLTLEVTGPPLTRTFLRIPVIGPSSTFLGFRRLGVLQATQRSHLDYSSPAEQYKRLTGTNSPHEYSLFTELNCAGRSRRSKM
jgi:hypothetical protein